MRLPIVEAPLSMSLRACDSSSGYSPPAGLRSLADPYFGR